MRLRTAMEGPLEHRSDRDWKNHGWRAPTRGNWNSPKLSSPVSVAQRKSASLRRRKSGVRSPPGTPSGSLSEMGSREGVQSRSET